MIELSDLHDNRNTKDLIIDQISNDHKEHWLVRLQTHDLPAPFENTNAINRQVSLSIISGNDLKASDHSDSFMVPVVLIGMSRVNDQTICYYSQRTESQGGGILYTTISASITLNDDQTPAENPYLLMEFKVVVQEQQDQLSGTSQQFGSQQERTPFLHTDLNENANGGIDIPIDQTNRAPVPGDKIVNA